MQRQLMSELIAWKSRAKRKPLLLKGARQTGKTWLLNEFASQQYQNVIRFDFMLEPSARSLFDGDLEPKRIISQIELLRGQTVTPADTLIIFDEIQEAPRGITSLKYFNELAPEYHIVAAGSYMGLALRRENESFPVGKIDQLTMRPMGFAEFVRAVDGDPLADAILAADMNLLANVAEKLEHLLKEYLVANHRGLRIRFWQTCTRPHCRAHEVGLEIPSRPACKGKQKVRLRSPSPRGACTRFRRESPVAHGLRNHS